MESLRYPTALVVVGLLSLCWTAAIALSVDEVVNPRSADSWVSDNAAMLSTAAESRIDARLDDLEEQTGAEVAVVTVPTVDAATPRDFATELFNHWGIGKADRDNGLLILMVEDERRLEMETGYGLEPELPDGWLYQMQQREMVPHFRDGNFDRGLERGVDAVAARLTGESVPGEIAAPDRTSSTGEFNLVGFLVALGIVAAIFGGLFFFIHYVSAKRQCPTCDVWLSRDPGHPRDNRTTHVYVCDCGFERELSAPGGGQNTYSSGGFGGSSSGGSFGGGSSGGGGAGSSW